jgi:hypothetical protein
VKIAISLYSYVCLHSSILLTNKYSLKVRGKGRNEIGDNGNTSQQRHETWFCLVKKIFRNETAKLEISEEVGPILKASPEIMLEVEWYWKANALDLERPDSIDRIIMGKLLAAGSREYILDTEKVDLIPHRSIIGMRLGNKDSVLLRLLSLTINDS